MSSNFYKRRRGILEHLEDGTISQLDLGVHDYLNLKANLVIGGNSSLPAGICKTSARAIHATCPTQISEKAIQRSLAHLERIGWIKRWNVQGKHGNYPVLICRGSVHDLTGNEYRVNGEETKDWRDPKYVLVGDPSASRGRTVQLLSTDREVREDKERKNKTAPSPKTGDLFQLPDWIPLNTWNAFLEMRKKLRRPMTPAAVRLAVKRLEDLRAAGNDPKAILENSILNGYQGLFEPRVDMRDMRAAQMRTDASVGKYDPYVKPREQTQEEKAEFDRIQIENERWDGLEKGTLPVNKETVAWVTDRQERFKKVRMPPADPRPKWFKAFWERATASGAAS